MIGNVVRSPTNSSAVAKHVVAASEEKIICQANTLKKLQLEAAQHGSASTDGKRDCGRSRRMIRPDRQNVAGQ